MSGVYIKGMEMPEGNWRGLILYANGDVREFLQPNKEYYAIPVPDHGRLVDADALYRRIKAECNPYGSPTIDYDDGLKVLGIIGSTPPIIPADKETDNET